MVDGDWRWFEELILMGDRHILVVEDDAVLSVAIREMLIEWGDIPNVVSSGEEAIEQAARANFDLILMDIYLKGEMDGIEAASQIHSFSDVPVIYLTAHADSSILERAKESNPYGYLVKPVKSAELRVSIEMALHKKELDARIKEVEATLQKANHELEARVRERTAELMAANEQLQKEVEERKLAQEALHENTVRLETVFTAIPQAILEYDADLRVVMANAAALKTAGATSLDFSRDEFVKKLKYACLDGGAVKLEDLPSSLVLRGEVNAENIYWVTTAEGDRRLVSTNASRLCKDGKINGVVVVLNDITELKQTEETLRKSEQRFRELAENIRDVFWVMTPAEILYVSPAYEEVWGRSCESLYAHPASMIESVHSDDLERVLHAWKAHNEGKTRFEQEYRIVRPDGSIRWVWDRSFPVWEQGKIVRTVGIAEDITALKETEEFLRIERDLAFDLGAAGSLVEVMKHLLQASLKFDDFDAGGIYLVEKETGALNLVCCHGLSDEFVKELSFHEPATSLARFAMRGRPGYWSRSAGTLKMSDILEKEKIRSLAAIPVTSEGEVVALLNLASHEQTEISRSVRSALEVLAAQIGGIISRVRLGETIKAQGERLREANAALKALLKQREEDRTDLEESLLDNVKELILPYIEKLRKTRLAEDQRLYIEIIESHLKEITSPFVRRVSAPFLGLTPTEIRVSDLIRQGRSSKEIAELLGASERTILFHRQSLRKKLGIKQKKINLQVYLASLAD